MPSSIKQKYWDISQDPQQWKNILLGNDHTFHDVVLKDLLRSPKAVVPVSGETAELATAAFMCFLSQKLFTDSGIVVGAYSRKAFVVSPFICRIY